MKHNLPLTVTAAVSSLALVLVAALSFLSSAHTWAAESTPKVVGVDYIIALMDAGIGQKDIVRRIEEKNLAFRLAPGDMDRLREAGAGKPLMDVVTAESAVLENHPGAYSGATTPPQGQGGTDASEWGRPSRLAGEEQPAPEGEDQQPEAAPPAGDQAQGNGEGIQEVPYGGNGGYGGGGYGAYPGYDYWSGYYGMTFSYGYPYPYYYSPYYYGYYYPYGAYYHSGPCYTYPHYSHGAYVPRGGAYYGGGGYYGGAPHGGGGGGHYAPRGGGGGHAAPHGSHH
jgi:hypothetical protein